MTMEKNESYERVSDGLGIAASCAYKLAKAQGSSTWTAVGDQLIALRARAKELYNSKPMTHAEALAMINQMVDKRILAADNGKTQ